ncbi:hypothetical protein EUGRSUZ_J01220 [Eucalyptus grandis]|uniref:Uncharacterized protein n=2 Tax=Eucalyptus grandis TaxID=71139 RepID=A0ACC3J6C8_EUCGR|nr:hypothetical protein EUGRSUZ_J01220 [Eucalyptus grandis]
MKLPTDYSSYGQESVAPKQAKTKASIAQTKTKNKEMTKSQAKMDYPYSQFCFFFKGNSIGRTMLLPKCHQKEKFHISRSQSNDASAPVKGNCKNS